jgi:hypothetical protein
MNSGNFCKMSRETQDSQQIIRLRGTAAVSVSTGKTDDHQHPIVSRRAQGGRLLRRCRRRGVSTDLFAAMQDLFNGRSSTYEKEAQNA